jgi:hypothetical protein
MANTYIWKIEQVKLRPQYQGKTDVVKEAAWRFIASDGQKEVSTYGSLELDDPSGDFVLYENLTEQQVIDWVQAKIGENRISTYKDAMDKGLAEQAAPKEIVKPLPWMPKP